MLDILKEIENIGIIPVVKLENPDKDAEKLAEALVTGGINAAEITFRADGADRAIRLMLAKHPDMLVGAGTVLCEEQVDLAIAAGAKFVVTPGLDIELVKYCQGKNIPIIPGCTTPTDYHAAYRLGLSVLKFFPAEQSGGLAKIKAMAAPFPMFRIMPTGGINMSNLKEYLSDSHICACGGSYMCSEKLLKEEKWDEITELCRKSIEIVKEVRNNG